MPNEDSLEVYDPKTQTWDEPLSPITAMKKSVATTDSETLGKVLFQMRVRLHWCDFEESAGIKLKWKKVKGLEGLLSNRPAFISIRNQGRGTRSKAWWVSYQRLDGGSLIRKYEIWCGEC
ncbi:unnamed protein product [Microthlaspi erraticum]|uniref:Uncharacterized protein n=1 Tax=Microthlaspi erraticum TaxID=1685480 RepID=A0A6D2J902_9BRAS|nr:unnamed protein product [Microthlaspi erraticum]CAA7036260.1 unnamed protein product [Microthlaspi erraticum]